MKTIEIKVIDYNRSYCFVALSDSHYLSEIIEKKLKENPDADTVVLDFSDIEYCYFSDISETLECLYKTYNKKIEKVEFKNLPENFNTEHKEYGKLEDLNDKVWQKQVEYKKWQEEWEKNHKAKVTKTK